MERVRIGVAMVAMMSLFALAQPAWGKLTTCKMTYSLEGWSAIYATARGRNGMTFSVIAAQMALCGVRDPDVDLFRF